MRYLFGSLILAGGEPIPLYDLTHVVILEHSLATYPSDSLLFCKIFVSNHAYNIPTTSYAINPK